MTDWFPLGHPSATTVYLGLYLVTWVVHALLASVVVGGASWAAIDAIRGRSGSSALAGALPLALGLAITAGVAPLLFVQLLYRQAFYTANLLLFVRYLAILPALLIAFYLFYFAKTERARRLSARARAALWSVAAGAAAFVGYAFAELHSLSLEPERWIDHYASGRWMHRDVAVAIRFAAFAGVCAATAPLAAAWLNRWSGGEPNRATGAPIAIAGLVVALGAVVVYADRLPGEITAAIDSPAVRVHVGGALIAAFAAAVAWAIAARAGAVGRRALWLATAATIGLLLELSILREAVRAVRLDLPSLYDGHTAAAASGGQIAFALFALINAAAIGWCVTRVFATRSEGAADDDAG